MAVQLLSHAVQTALRNGVIVTSPAHAVVELVLNSLDAGATSVAVQVDLKIFKIQVIDNGCGMGLDDLDSLGPRYMTSKCHTLEDLRSNVVQYGFRGEALASIIGVSGILLIISRPSGNVETYCKAFTHGKSKKGVISNTKRPANGTTIIIQDFMCTMPVRRKRISEVIDLEEIRSHLECIALIHPEVSFSLRNDFKGCMVLHKHKSSNLLSSFQHLFGQVVAQSLAPVNFSSEKFKINGFISKEPHTQKNLQFIYVNKRVIVKTKLHQLVNALLGKSAILRANGPWRHKPVPKGVSTDWLFAFAPSEKRRKFAVFVIHIECASKEYDVYLDPRKTLIEFEDWQGILNCMQESIRIFLERECLAYVEDDSNSSSQESNSSKIDNTECRNKNKIQKDKTIERSQIQSVNKDVNNLNYNKGVSSLSGDSGKWLNDVGFRATVIPRAVYGLPAKRRYGKIDNSNMKSKTMCKTSRKLCIDDIIDSNVVEDTLSICSAGMNEFKDVVDTLTIPHTDVTVNHSLDDSDCIPSTGTVNIKNTTSLKEDSIHNPKLKPKHQPRVSKLNILRSAHLFKLHQMKEQVPEYSKRQSTFCGDLGVNVIPNPYSKAIGVNCFSKPIYPLSSNIINISKRSKILNTPTFQVNRTTSAVDEKHAHEAHYNDIKSKEVGFESKCVEIRSANSSENVSVSEMKFISVPSCCSPYFTSSLLGNKSGTREFLQNTLDTDIAKVNGTGISHANLSPSQKSTLDKDKISGCTSKTVFFEEGKEILVNLTIKENENVNSSPLLNVSSNYQMPDLLFSKESPYFSSKQILYKDVEGSTCLNVKTAMHPTRKRNSDRDFVNVYGKRASIENKSITCNDITDMMHVVLDKDSKQGNVKPIAVSTEEHLKVSDSVVNKVIVTTNRVQELSVTSNKDVTKTAQEDITEVNSSPKRSTTSEEWIQKLDHNGQIFYIHLHSGITSYNAPSTTSEQNLFTITKRYDFLPKGMSPLVNDSIPEGLKAGPSLTPGTREALHTAIVSNVSEDELATVKWKNARDSINTGNKELLKKLLTTAENQMQYCEKPLPSLSHAVASKLAVKMSSMFNSYKFNKDIFTNLQVVNQWDGKFIVTLVSLETGKKPHVIGVFDQHAVHERIRLEALMKEYLKDVNDSSLASSDISPHITLELSCKETRILSSFEADFKRIGLKFEMISDISIKVTKVPTCLHTRELRERSKGISVLKNLLQILIESHVEFLIKTRGNGPKIPEILQEVINYEACRGAIKFGDLLTNEDCEALLVSLSQCELPFFCAHGRPSFVPIFDLTQFERQKKHGWN